MVRSVFSAVFFFMIIMAYMNIILLAHVFCICGLAYAGIEVGYSNVYQDTIAGETVVEHGEVPNWIDGSYIRHSCGAYGETGSTLNIANRVTHLFDCIEMGQSYRFENGKVTFYNRYYDTAINDLWRAYDMNMNNSRVFWLTIYTPVDYERQQALAPILQSSGKIASLPHVTFWEMNGKVYSHSEYPGLVQIDPHEVTNSPHFHTFDDNNFGYGSEIVLDEMAHEVQDPDGTIYCAHMVLSFDPLRFIVRQWKNVFTVRGNVRQILTRIEYPDLDLRMCVNGLAYPILLDRQGYLHSMASTENYLIIPESSYLVDICSLIVNQRTYQPVFEHYFDWEPTVPTRVRVIRKSDGRQMATINTRATFVTHQINAYEEGDLLMADMITFNDSSPYTYYTYVSRLIQPVLQENDIERFTINMTDWSVERRPLVAGPVSTDFPNINPNFLARRYRYVYTVFGQYTAAPQDFVKINVDTGAVTSYRLPDGLFGFEPLFLPSPGSVEEDDGVVVLQGLDANQEKGFLMIFNASDVTLISHLTGSDLVLFGIHAKFYPSHIGSMVVPEPPIATASVTAYSVFSMLCTVLMVNIMK